MSAALDRALPSTRSTASDADRAAPCFTELEGMGVVYFGNDWRAENRTSSHHIARRLRQWCPVLYVDSPGLRAPRASARDLRRLLRKLTAVLRKPVQVLPGLWHCTVPQIPLRGVPGVGALNELFGRWAVRRAIAAVGFERYLSWFAVPHPGFMAGEIGEELIVYYCIDDYAAHPGVDERRIAAVDAELTRRADQVFVAPPALLSAKTQLNASTSFAPHGVDFDLFARAAQETTVVAPRAAALRGPVIGFFGSLADWIDVELLAELGRRRPAWTFLMVGHVSTDAAALEALPNFVFVGPQPYEDLPAWAKAFDVAVIPYRRNRQVQNANPLKLREYLATGKPVVSVPTPEVERFLPHVRLASTPEAFLAEIESALREDSPDRRSARMSFVRTMSWDTRVAETAAIVNAALTRRRSRASGRKP